MSPDSASLRSNSPLTRRLDPQQTQCRDLRGRTHAQLAGLLVGDRPRTSRAGAASAPHASPQHRAAGASPAAAFRARGGRATGTEDSLRSAPVAATGAMINCCPPLRGTFSQRSNGGVSDAPTRSRPGTITVSNCSPFDLWIVSSSTYVSGRGCAGAYSSSNASPSRARSTGAPGASSSTSPSASR